MFEENSICGFWTKPWPKYVCKADSASDKVATDCKSKLMSP